MLRVDRGRLGDERAGIAACAAPEAVERAVATVYSERRRTAERSGSPELAVPEWT